MKIRINLTEAKALEDPKKAAADKKAADKKAAEKKAAAKEAAEKKAEEKEKEAKKKAKLKESLRPMIAKMIKENNGFGSTVEEEEDASLVNTADEKNLSGAIDKSPIVKDRLSRISSANEVDGAIETIINAFGLKNMPKGTIQTALKNALTKIAPEGSAIGAEPKL